MLQALVAWSNARTANVITIAHRNAANSAKKTVTANVATTATTVTASASANALTVRTSQAGHADERPVYLDTILIDRSFLFNLFYLLD